MLQQSVQPTQQEKKRRTPVLVVIISWLMLLSGIGSLLLTAPLLFIGGVGNSGIVFGLGGLTLVRGIGLVVVSFGIRNLRRWALYTYTGLTALAIILSIYSYATSPIRDNADFIGIGIQAIILIYFWAIAKRFN